MSRKYTVPLTGLALTAAGEMLSITAAAGKFVRITRLVIKAVNNALPTAQMFQFNGNVIPAPTAGTGGTAVTPQRTQQGDPAATTTAVRGNTGPTTGTVTATPYSDGCYAYQGIDTPAPGEGITLVNGAAFVLNLLQAPAGSVSVSFDGYLEISEEG